MPKLRITNSIQHKKKKKKNRLINTLYLQEVEAVRSTTGIVLDRLIQVFCIFYMTAAEHLGHADGNFFITPVQLIDICVVTGFDAFVSVLRPGRWDKSQLITNSHEWQTKPWKTTTPHTCRTCEVAVWPQTCQIFRCYACDRRSPWCARCGRDLEHPGLSPWCSQRTFCNTLDTTPHPHPLFCGSASLD